MAAQMIKTEDEKRGMFCENGCTCGCVCAQVEKQDTLLPADVTLLTVSIKKTGMRRQAASWHGYVW